MDNVWTAFHLYDRMPVEKSTNYVNALTGNWESNLLSKAIFLKY